MDKLWELLSLKVIHLTVGKRALLTRKLQAGEHFSWVLPVHQKVSGTWGNTSCCQSPSAALLCTSKKQVIVPPSSTFFDTHLFLLTLTASLALSDRRIPALPHT